MSKILIVEDNLFSYLFLDFMLVTAEKVWVDNGQKAVDQIKSGCPFDAIIMNCQMPVMDGLTATKHIRKLGFKGPIIGWSLYSKYMEEASLGLNAGMNLFVEKGQKNLGVTVIAEYLERNGLL